MRIIIVGAGKVGRTLAEQLLRESHELTLVDNDERAVEHAAAGLDVMGICGSGTTRSTLTEAGVSRCDLLIATTGADELNILCCLIARRLGARHTVARVRNPEYSDQMEFMRNQLGISMAINPELIAAGEIFQTLRFPAALKIENFSRGRVQMVELRLREGGPLGGVPLRELYRKYQVKVQISSVARGDRLVIPNGDFVLHDGDVVGITATPQEIERFFSILGVLKSSVKSVMLLGGGRIAYYLARRLLSIGCHVVVIDKDPARCVELSDLLPAATVIEGNGADRELLEEEGIGNVDAFVALTGVDEENIILSLYARTRGVGKLVTKVNSSELIALMTGFGLESAVSPRELTADQILRYARSLENAIDSGMESLYQIAGGRAEAVEFRVSGDVPGLTDVPLRDIRLKPQILVASITHDEKVIVPTGDDLIRRGDRVIVVAVQRQIGDIADILA